jgi:hypothetical protein
MISCARESCPRVVRSDCARWLTEIEGELPTFVVRAQNERGEDVADVAVFVDGERVASRIDGRPIPIDPGEHTLRFEGARGMVRTQRVIVRSGERGRLVSVSFASAASHGGAGTSSRVGPFALGGAGLALGAAGGVLWSLGRRQHDELASTCAPTGSCATSDIDAARTQLVAGDVAVAAGVLALAGAIYWYVAVTPRASAPARAALVTF